MTDQTSHQDYFCIVDPPVEAFPLGLRLVPATNLPAAATNPATAAHRERTTFHTGIHARPGQNQQQLQPGGADGGVARNSGVGTQPPPFHQDHDQDRPDQEMRDWQEETDALYTSGSYRDDLSRPTTVVPLIQLGEGPHAVYVVPDFVERHDGSYGGIRVSFMMERFHIQRQTHPLLSPLRPVSSDWLYAFQVNSHCFVYRVHLSFSDGPGCIYLCSCMRLAWEALAGLDVSGSSREECARIGGTPCQHSLAVAAVFEAPEEQMQSCSCLGDASLHPQHPVEVLELDDGIKVRMVVDCRSHPCAEPDSLGLIGNDSNLHFKCFSCGNGNGSYSCKHVESLLVFLNQLDSLDDFYLSMASFSPHPRFGPAAAATGSGRQQGANEARASTSRSTRKPVSYKAIPEKLRNAATSARARGALLKCVLS